MGALRWGGRGKHQEWQDLMNYKFLLNQFCAPENQAASSSPPLLLLLLPFLLLSIFHLFLLPLLFILIFINSIVQLLNCVWLLVTPRTAACQASLSITISWSLLKLMSLESAMPSNHLILCHPLLLLPLIFPNIRCFSNEWALLIRLPKYWSFSISLSSEYSRLISFRIDWFDLLAVQGTLKSLL